MKVDLLLVADHLGVECGVRYTYLKFIEWCESVGISLALISDLDENLSFDSLKAQLNLVVPDVNQDVPLKRRPMYSLIHNGKVIHQNLHNHKINQEHAYWLDAWNGDRSWFNEVLQKCDDFVSRINPGKVVLATQSFLGFVMESIYGDQDPIICLHTNYPSFYAIRISGTENELFNIIEVKAKERLYKYFIDKKKHLFLNSEMSERFFKKDTNLSYQIFTPGVDTSLFTPNLQKSNGILRILYVGRFSKEKGIDSISNLIKSTPFAKWILAGKITDRLQIDIPENASYLGSLDHSKLAKEMGKSDLFIFYGKWDTFGMVALEALSCALPVLATEGSEIGRIVETNKCGWVFSSTEELISIIENINKDGIHLDIKKNARSYAEKMTWKNTFNDFASKLKL